METTYEVASYVRRFSAKTILGAIFVAGVATLAGCSDGTETSGIPPVSCELASTSFVSSSVQVGVDVSEGASPDVSIRGKGFPPGAKLSIGYFGLPGAESGAPTADLDFDEIVTIASDGTFALTQRAIGSPRECAADEIGSTIGIAVGAGGVLGGTTVPEAFWCTNASTESYASACQ